MALSAGKQKVAVGETRTPHLQIQRMAGLRTIGSRCRKALCPPGLKVEEALTGQKMGTTEDSRGTVDSLRPWEPRR